MLIPLHCIGGCTMAGGCTATGKRQYATRREARIALNKLLVRRAGHKTERSAYSCKFCNEWHITKMGEKPRELKPTRMPPAKRWRKGDPIEE